MDRRSNFKEKLGLQAQILDLGLEVRARTLKLSGETALLGQPGNKMVGKVMWSLP